MARYEAVGLKYVDGKPEWFSLFLNRENTTNMRSYAKKRLLEKGFSLSIIHKVTTNGVRVGIF